MKLQKQTLITLIKMTMDNILNITLKKCAHILLEMMPSIPSNNSIGKLFNQLLECLMAKTVRKIMIKIITYHRNKKKENDDIEKDDNSKDKDKNYKERNQDDEQNKIIHNDPIIKYSKIIRLLLVIKTMRLLNQLKLVETMRRADLLNQK